MGGWAYVLVHDPLLSKVEAFTSQIPVEVRVSSDGDVFNAETMHPFHATFVLRLPGESSSSKQRKTVETLTHLLADIEAIPVQVNACKGIVISRVERIRSRTVYAAVLELSSERLRQVRQYVADAIGGGCAIRYASDGHISLCYVDAVHEQQLRELAATHNTLLFNEGDAISFEVTSIVVEFGSRTRKVRYTVPFGKAEQRHHQTTAV
jgi:hypothetical protein